MTNWKETSFDQAVCINPSVPMKRGDQYPFVDMKAIEPGTRSVSESEMRAFKGGGSRFIPNDTLMARITPCLENGKIARYISDSPDEPAHGSTEFIVIRGREKVTDNDFAYYLTCWQEFRDFAIAQMTGSSGRQRVPTDSLNKFELRIPSLAVQKRIAGILGSLDDKIELNRRMNETLEAMARAVFQSWFVDFDPVLDNALAAGVSLPAELKERASRRKKQNNKHPLPKAIKNLFPDSFNNSPLGPIPTGWKICKIADIADINTWTLGKQDALDVIDYIEISGIMRGEIQKITHFTRGAEPSRARRRLRHGDTILSTVRPDRGAYCLVLNPSNSLIASTGFAVLTPKDGNWAFLYAATTLAEFGQELGLLADGGAYPAIRPEVIGNRDIVNTKDEELLKAFEIVTQPLLEKADKNRSENEILIHLRDTLLPKLLTGEIEV